MLGRNPVRVRSLSAALLVAALAIPPTAAAQPPTGNCGYPPGDIYAHEFQCNRYDEFYTPPDPLPKVAAGAVIRTQPMRLVYEPSGQLGGWVATARRIMYRSNDSRGVPNVVTGTYFEPDRPWTGTGPRPLVAFAPGTQGQGDQCAPSRVFEQSIHFSSGLDITLGYEEMFVATMVARGFAVVVTDYEGLGTPGVHTYVNRVAEAHAVLDAARAARSLPGTSLTPDGPVALWGYSQGGGAVGAAVELAPLAPRSNWRRTTHPTFESSAPTRALRPRTCPDWRPSSTAVPSSPRSAISSTVCSRPIRRWNP